MSARRSSSSSAPCRSATRSCGRTKPSCGGCSRSAPKRPAPRRLRRFTRCTNAWVSWRVKVPPRKSPKTTEGGDRMRNASRAVVAALVVVLCAAAALVAGVAGHGSATAATAGPCQLGNKDGQIKHVIYLQFDNTHYRRDNPLIASDLEQMPNLLNFLKNNGTLATNDHTILISHTAGGILSSLTGLYPDRQGQTVSNGYFYFSANGTPTFSSSFKYWTNTVDGTNETLPNMVGDGGQTTPAPWLTYTHAGCNVGGVSAANIELENNSVNPGGDVATVYGAGSPEAAEP